MKSPKHHRIFSIVLGTGLLIMGSFFVLPLMVAAYMLGLMLIGFGAEPRMADEAEAAFKSSPSAKPPVMSASPRPKNTKSRKKPSRRKK
ncbi:MAG: hypothetical protein AB1295_04180 [Candidatus Micrarchaeota archaeon]